MPSVVILLATYNGEAFLSQQLDSLEKQTYTNWKLYVIDDQSTASTYYILETFQKKLGFDKIYLRKGQRLGCPKTFLTLVCDPNIIADYYAYCGQDDIWDEHKLARCVELLTPLSNDHCQLYFSRTCIIDEKDRDSKLSVHYQNSVCFQNAIIQNIAPGNTILFNCLTKKRLMKIGIVSVGMHDWWTDIIVSACGGKIVYDKAAHLFYRLHENNLIGVPKGWKGLKRKLLYFFEGRSSKLLSMHLDPLRPL